MKLCSKNQLDICVHYMSKLNFKIIHNKIKFEKTTLQKQLGAETSQISNTVSEKMIKDIF